MLGSCTAIAVSLGAVLIIFLVLGSEHPRLQAEFPGLVGSLLIFTAMTAICGLSFYLLLIRHAWRRAAQTAMWAGLAATAWYYWP